MLGAEYAAWRQSSKSCEIGSPRIQQKFPLTLTVASQVTGNTCEVKNNRSLTDLWIPTACRSVRGAGGDVLDFTLSYTVTLIIYQQWSLGLLFSVLNCLGLFPGSESCKLSYRCFETLLLGIFTFSALS